MSSVDIYHSLTGKNHPTDASVLDIAEHGRVGGVSTGKSFKQVGIVETLPTDATNLNSSFSYDITGSVCVISQVVGLVTYQKTYDWSTNPITESVWVQV
jgi:hypothetical protein